MASEEVLETVEAEDEEDTLKHKYLTFALGNEEYGIEVQYVTEIIGVQPITEMPDMPNFVKGVINLRGKHLHYARWEGGYNSFINKHLGKCFLVGGSDS